MFKKRIKVVITNVSQFMLIAIGFSLFLWAGVSWNWLGKTIEFIGISLFVLIGAGGILIFIYYICKFIYWLFIEPFRKKASTDETKT